MLDTLSDTGTLIFVASLVQLLTRSCIPKCYTEKATEARHRLERQYNACTNRKKQCRPNETIPECRVT